MFVPFASEIQIVWSKDCEIFSILTKKTEFLKPFWQSVDTILEDVSVDETIVSC